MGFSFTRVILLSILFFSVSALVDIVRSEIIDPEVLQHLKKAEVESIDRLTECTFFKEKLPKSYSKFIEWKNKKKLIKYYYTNYEGICAAASTQFSMIWIHERNIHDPGCLPLRSTLGHEILHLAGLPNHVFKDMENPTPKELLKDKIYTLERKCLN